MKRRLRPLDYLRKAASCRRLAAFARHPELIRALNELADDFERAALDGAADELSRPQRKRATTLRKPTRPETP
jgi:hypothetical protein